MKFVYTQLMYKYGSKMQALKSLDFLIKELQVFNREMTKTTAVLHQI